MADVASCYGHQHHAYIVFVIVPLYLELLVSQALEISIH